MKNKHNHRADMKVLIGLSKLDYKEVSKLSGIGYSTIKNYITGTGDMMHTPYEAIREALENYISSKIDSSSSPNKSV